MIDWRCANPEEGRHQFFSSPLIVYPIAFFIINLLIFNPLNFKFVSPLNANPLTADNLFGLQYYSSTSSNLE